ncbi:hypothetical protein Rumeso_04054 [Rubellimicrobium mesophilum DSM 19309]|uniref:Uncharacterized protein n=1 Tax=Rubellimicrobium mesophilum DSM 19309 TaxID=442562 RepID=A0A017HKQ3_9RHOB|nr:hypothetical protein [Rubellimicrobium mesophilum]EYD74369.1 hypothetical protein Rumeso_04054 [Rubellimicrobium mesophilum DSM 19309]
MSRHRISSARACQGISSRSLAAISSASCSDGWPPQFYPAHDRAQALKVLLAHMRGPERGLASPDQCAGAPTDPLLVGVVELDEDAAWPLGRRLHGKIVGQVVLVPRRRLGGGLLDAGLPSRVAGLAQLHEIALQAGLNVGGRLGPEAQLGREGDGLGGHRSSSCGRAQARTDGGAVG